MSLLQHPAIVHFPTVLLIASVVVDIVGVILRSAGLTQVGCGLLLTGGVSAAAAALSGPGHGASDPASIALLHRHQLYAALVIIGCLIMIGVRLWRIEGLAGPGVYGYLGLGLLLIVAVVLVGHAGGQLTYAHGVGVAVVPRAGRGRGEGGTPQANIAKGGGLLIVGGLGLYALLRRRFLLARFHAWRAGRAAPTTLGSLSRRRSSLPATEAQPRGGDAQTLGNARSFIPHDP